MTRRDVVRAAAYLRARNAEHGDARRPSLARSVSAGPIGGLAKHALAELAIYAGGSWALRTRSLGARGVSERVVSFLVFRIFQVGERRRRGRK